MICIYCGYDTNGEDACPYCGKSLVIYKRIINASNMAYNEGLRRANVRDLSGAVEYLEKALKFNKYHIEARNLLGLVYFEMGNMVYALREWVISKNFQSDNNRADFYMEELRRGQMNKLNHVAQKYNMAIDYCRTGDYDLAKIQLKSVLNKNSTMVSAYQLLALLYMMEGNTQAASKKLREAEKIDVNNATTLLYLKEIESALPNKKEQKKKLSENMGQEAIKRHTFTDAIDSSINSIFNVIIGIVIGVLAAVFLILPSIQQRANEDTINALKNANEEAVGAESNVASLNDKVEDLEKKLESYEGQSDVKGGYEKLIELQEIIEADSFDDAANILKTINRDLLDVKGQAVYDSISEVINTEVLKKEFDNATNLSRRKDYEGAIASYLAVIDIDEMYENGAALLGLAEAYQETEDDKKALEIYEKIKELFDKQPIADTAIRQIEELSKEAEE